EWAKIRVGTRVGYVVCAYLRFDAALTAAPTASPSASPTPAPSASPSPTPAVPAGETVVGEAVVVTQNGRTLNFRSTARVADNVIGQIPAGEVLPVLSKGSEWCRVLYGGKAGYVMTSFLAFAGPTASPSPLASPTPTPEPEVEVFPRTLKLGMAGDDVKELQGRLIALKYNCRVSGTYDDMTKAAVTEFQRINALTADGIFGPTSAQTLLGAHARPADSLPLIYKTLRIDNADPSGTSDIADLQARLKELGYPISVNGRFDIPTHQAVVGFQQRNALPITGIANAQTQAAAFGSAAKGYATPVTGISADEGRGGGPATSQVKLLHWFNEVKPAASAGQQATVHHPATNSTFTVRFYSMGHHADSEPLTWRDTQIMNRAFGAPSWNINAVYVQLPDGRWSLAAMHNRPHLTGAISANGFGGHLCIHFLRDTAEVMANDPDYGASNQRAIRKAWLGMTGEAVE
ncbi:MAG TPA: peptidoglycan-binding protein, partial [Candidatus Limnocylindria bacterium]|nr:peptidoglycan-binding protein [Candidatus Limnocylindria bacterium]